jgi:hypothetical protein
MPDDGRLTGVGQVIINNTAGVVSSNLYDVFGVVRYEQGSAQTSVPPRGREGVTAQWEPCAPRGL